MSEPRFRVALPLVLLAIASCSGPPASEDDLLRRESEFEAAVASGDVERFSGFVDEEAVFLGADGSLLEGRAAVVEDWRPLIEDPALELTWEPLGASLSEDGSMGYTHGSWQLTREDAEGSAVLLLAGRYATIWRRGPDGVWRVVLDVGNTDAG